VSSKPLSSTFLSVLEPELRERLSVYQKLEETLQDIYFQASTHWPTLTLREDEFFPYLADIINRFPPQMVLSDEQTCKQWLEELQTDALFLTCACALRKASALVLFEKTFSSAIRPILHRFRTSDVNEEDLLQTLREKLFVETSQKQAKIRSYAGQGQLENWLRVTAMRTFLDVVRTGVQQKREYPTAEEELLHIPHTGLDLELEFLKREYRAHFKEAFEAALVGLSCRERNLLRQHLIAKLTIDQIGTLYHIHRATAARRLAKARQSLLEATRRELTKRLHISKHEFESIMKLIQSRLDLSLHRIFQQLEQPMEDTEETKQ